MMRYSTTWRRSYAEWDYYFDGRDNHWYPVTDQREPWRQWIRRIAKRLVPRR